MQNKANIALLAEIIRKSRDIFQPSLTLMEIILSSDMSICMDQTRMFSIYDVLIGLGCLSVQFHKNVLFIKPEKKKLCPWILGDMELLIALLVFSIY